MGCTVRTRGYLLLCYCHLTLAMFALPYCYCYDVLIPWDIPRGWVVRFPGSTHGSTYIVRYCAVQYIISRRENPTFCREVGAPNAVRLDGSDGGRGWSINKSTYWLDWTVPRSTYSVCPSTVNPIVRVPSQPPRAYATTAVKGPNVVPESGAMDLIPGRWPWRRNGALGRQ